MVLKHHPHSTDAGFSQQVESWRKKKSQWQMETFPLPGSCSCCLFRGGVFGVWMAGKCDRNKCGIVRHPNGIPHLHHASSVTASCRIQFTLDGSIFTREDSMNKEQFNHRVPPLFSFPPGMRKDGMKEKGGRKTMWKKLQQSRLFDIHLDCEGRVQSQKCVCARVCLW